MGEQPFVYVLKLAQPELSESMSAEEEKILNEHFEYLKRKLSDGTLVLAGPCLDGAFGIVIFQAHSEQEAEDFMKCDPAVKKALMTAELHPFRISLMKER